MSVGIPLNAGTAAASPAFETDRVSLSIGGARILEEVTLAVEPGECVGLIGPNGAGKTTLLNILSGLRRPSNGRVVMGGVDITGEGAARRARRGIGRTFQDSNVFDGLTVLENARIAARAAMGGSASILRRPSRRDKAVERAEECLSAVGLERRQASLSRELSYGDKRKLELAILLATRSSVALLDEPMAGVSVENVPELSDLIHRVHEEFSLTILMVEHHLDVVFDLASQIAVLHHGSLIAFDTPDKVMADPAVQTAYLGETV